MPLEKLNNATWRIDVNDVARKFWDPKEPMEFEYSLNNGATWAAAGASDIASVTYCCPAPGQLASGQVVLQPPLASQSLTNVRIRSGKYLLWGTLKNMFELKMGRNVTISDNVIDGSAAEAQSGRAFVLTPRTCEAGDYSWAVIENVTIERNVLRNAASTIGIQGRDEMRRNNGYNCDRQSGRLASVTAGSAVLASTGLLTSYVQGAVTYPLRENDYVVLQRAAANVTDIVTMGSDGTLAMTNAGAEFPQSLQNGDGVFVYGVDGYGVTRGGANQVQFIRFTADPENGTLAATSHRLANGTAVRLRTDGVLPGGLDTGATYYVVNAAANAFQLATESGGPTVSLTSAGSGSHWISNRANLALTVGAATSKTSQWWWGPFNEVAVTDSDTAITCKEPWGETLAGVPWAYAQVRGGQTSEIIFRDNLNILDPFNLGYASTSTPYALFGAAILGIRPASVDLNHNTYILKPKPGAPNTFLAATYFGDSTTEYGSGIYFRNNIVPGALAVVRDGNGNESAAVITKQWCNNGTEPCDDRLVNNVFTQRADPGWYASSNRWVASAAEVGFADQNNDVYKLRSGRAGKRSAFLGAANDGKDPGAAITPLPLVAGLSIQAGARWAAFSYQAPNETPCVLEVSESAAVVKRNGDYRVITDLDPAYFPRPDTDADAGRAVKWGRRRSMLAGRDTTETGLDGQPHYRGLSPGTTYYYRLMCAGDARQGSFQSAWSEAPASKIALRVRAPGGAVWAVAEFGDAANLLEHTTEAVPCTPACGLQIESAKPVYVRVRYQDAQGATVRTDATRMMLP
jgi:hypothetical protein